MLQNGLQNNLYLELFDSKNIKEKDKMAIFKVNNANNHIRTFNKQIKSFVLDLSQNSNKIIFPRDQKQQLNLAHQYIVFQILIHASSNFTLQFVITDINKTKKRIIFTNSVNKLQRKPFTIKLTNQQFLRDKWINLSFDIFSFAAGFSAKGYRSLDHISITGSLKLRRIYTSQRQLGVTVGNNDCIQSNLASILPNHFFFGPGIPYATQMFDYFNFLQDISELKPINTTDIQNDAQFCQNKTTSTKFKDFMKNEFSNSKLEKFKNEKQSEQKQQIKEKKQLIRYKGRRSVDANQKKKLLLNNTKTANQSQYLKQVKTVNIGEDGMIKKDMSHNISLGKQKIRVQNANMVVAKTRFENTNTQTKIINKLPPLNKSIQFQKQEQKWRNKHEIQNEQVTQQIKIIDQQEREIHSAKSIIQKKFTNKIIHKNLEEYKLNTNNKPINNNTHYSQTKQITISEFSNITDKKFYKPELSKYSHKNQLSQIQSQKKLEIEKKEEQKNLEKKQEESIKQELEINSAKSQQRKQILAKINLIKMPLQNINKINQMKQNIINQISQKETPVINSKQNFIDLHLQKVFQDIYRPYSPPLTNPIQQTKGEQVHQNIESKEVSLIYDPVLKCYYDFKTNTFYELKV